MFKYAVINIQNEDNYCFLWCILAYLYPNNNNPTRVSSYRQHFHSLKIKGMSFPPAPKDIILFEKLNNISVTVIGYDGDKNFFPYHIITIMTDQEGDMTKCYPKVSHISRAEGEGDMTSEG